MSDMNRRDFLKMLGLAGVALPATKLIGHVGQDELVEDEVEYGGFLIQRHTASNPPYQVDDGRYQRMPQKNIMFMRALWDQQTKDMMAKYKTVPKDLMTNKVEGFTQLEYAFYTASWTVAMALGTGEGSIGGGNRGLASWTPLKGTRTPIALQGGKWQADDYSPEEVTQIVKTVAKFFGASLAGVSAMDERWIYSSRMMRFDKPGTEAPIVFDDVPEPVEKEDMTLVIPKSMKWIISLAFEMDPEGIATYNSGIGSAATGNGYSRKAFTVASVAEFIRGLGYNAIPSPNDTGLSVPMAIDAGLGELSRMGLLVTPKYGPRVRLAKVITDLPLVPDSPISFGVQEFCEVCGKCADACPSGGIAKKGEPRTMEPINLSTNPGVLKWPINAEKCYEQWQINGMDCSLCLRACPFNKPDNWLHEATRILVGARSGTLDQIMLNLDNASRYGEQLSPSKFWKTKKNFIHAKE
jgi:epoxyqueuosine reductase